jgi:hypothetical protein
MRYPNLCIAIWRKALGIPAVWGLDFESSLARAAGTILLILSIPLAQFYGINRVSTKSIAKARQNR